MKTCTCDPLKCLPFLFTTGDDIDEAMKMRTFFIVNCKLRRITYCIYKQMWCMLYAHVFTYTIIEINSIDFTPIIEIIN